MGDAIAIYSGPYLAQACGEIVTPHERLEILNEPVARENAGSYVRYMLSQSEKSEGQDSFHVSRVCVIIKKNRTSVFAEASKKKRRNVAEGEGRRGGRVACSGGNRVGSNEGRKGNDKDMPF